MITTIIISAITFVGIALSIVLFPHIKIKNIKIDTYWLIAFLGALLLVITLSCPINEIVSSWSNTSAVNPIKILILFFSMTILSIYLDEIGLFKYLASLAVKKAKSHQKVLFVFLYVLISALTIFTSNDIVILTFTPFICFFCKHAKISPLPYLVAEFVAANTWSMMFIIGNPTNIYLGTSAGLSFISYFEVMALPTVLAGMMEFDIIFLLFNKKLSVPLQDDGAEIVHIESKVDLIIGLAHLLICLVFLVISSPLHIEMWIVSLISAVSLLICSLIVRLIKKKQWSYLSDSFKRLPYQLIPFILSMSIIVIAINYQGIAQKIGEFLNQGNVIFTYGYASFLGSNVFNNIPMSILFSEVATTITDTSVYLKAIYATIIGSNIGAFLTPIGALAGIMLSNLVNKYEIKYTFLDFIKYGAIVSVPVISVALLGLLLIVH